MITTTTSAIVGLSLASCSDDTKNEPAGSIIEPTASSLSTPNATGPSEAADIAAVRQVHAEYWDAVITSENRPTTADRSLFDGIATGAAVETQLADVGSLKEDGIRRLGAPTLGEPAITVDGDSATVEVCVDSSTWGAAVGDTTAPPQTPHPRPSVVALERTDETWLVTEQIPSDEATITC
ncbi:hypothetical protein CLV30_11779 [Haloactinopolyspora alba]|uniref:SnoaL-like protein n=1 Tax=Haloactinopolyspora alba TaxID=648780 RepID=A0A2P8DRD2_9ACTN|nr:hypothetical protein [Haloactinopolyspora alba]PSK99776.1 hypothetical protein CLV30_11779 [Haloactinopolyspora alba]